MKKLNSLFALSFCLLIGLSPLLAQNGADSLTDELRTKLINNLKHFTIGFYVDTYSTQDFDKNKDTSNIVPYFANCPMTEQIRLNVAAIEMFYDAEKVRGKIQLQFGDAPNLLATPDKQWIKNIRQAAIGFRVTKKLWADFGFMFTPVGAESAWPVINPITTASLCAYFEPGAVLGAKFTYKFSEKVSAGFMFGNPYSVAYQQHPHISGIMFISYNPLPNLLITYNNLFGNQALRDANLNNNLLYNDIYVAWDPIRNLNLVGQFDFAFQTNSKLAPDTNKVASMCSGWILARYNFLKIFSVTARYEYFNDPQGFLTGTFKYNGKTTGLMAQGFSAGFEVRPVKIAYIRAEYKFLHATPGNNIYYSGTSDQFNGLIINTGVRF